MSMDCERGSFAERKKGGRANGPRRSLWRRLVFSSAGKEPKNQHDDIFIPLKNKQKIGHTDDEGLLPMAETAMRLHATEEAAWQALADRNEAIEAEHAAGRWCKATVDDHGRDPLLMRIRGLAAQLDDAARLMAEYEARTPRGLAAKAEFILAREEIEGLELNEALSALTLSLCRDLVRSNVHG